MLIKIFSALAIVASCFYIGREMADNLKRRAETLDGFICALSMTGDFISALSMPLCDIYKNLAEHIKILNPFFTQLANSSQPSSVSWKTALKTVRCLTDDDRKIILSMSKTLGMCDIETQINSLNLTMKQLRGNLEDAKTKIKSDAGMYKSVSLFTGIGIAVLLI